MNHLFRRRRWACDVRTRPGKRFGPHWRLGLLLCVGMAPGWVRADLFLPGTQPKENGIDLGEVRNCRLCHSGTTNGAADPFFSWQGGMMAQAARDPVFRAALAVANQDIAGIGEFCIRCHSPRGWLAGRSTAANASGLDREDMNGVSCAACHRFVDPLSDEARKLAKFAPPGYGNAMYVASVENAVRGPYSPSTEVKPHFIVKTSYTGSSELCGNCHNVSNPTLAQNVTNQPPHVFGHIERTYSEWALSDYAKKDTLKTCQECHYPRAAGGGQASRYGARHEDYFVEHGAVGGSTWVQDAVYRIWKGKDLDRAALDAGKTRARELLRTAAALGLDCAEGRARLTITNLTGHKLPTGYPEGRRMWVNVKFMDASSNVLAELGRYGTMAQELGGMKVTVPTLLEPEKTRVYECLPAISTSQGTKYNKAAGPSFHFVLNDVIGKDNRIPPRGFNEAAFAGHLDAPVGAHYAEGQYWDQVEFDLPPGTEQVEARLMYQSVSWEYLKFLVEENKTDTWGKQLYESWEATGKCPPEEIAAVHKLVKGG